VRFDLWMSRHRSMVLIIFVSIMVVSNIALLLMEAYQAVDVPSRYWLVFGAALMLEAALVTYLLLRRKEARSKCMVTIALSAGALVGMIVAGSLPGVPMVKLFGLDLIGLIIGGAIAAIISLLTWNMRTGALSIAIGAFIGMFLGILFGLGVAFLPSITGYPFPSPGELLSTLSFSIASGFEMGMVGGTVGMLLGKILHPLPEASI